jgi:hypothetical protein
MTMAVFTFGYGQHCECGRSLAECYTVLEAEHWTDARDRMIELWGQTWSRQYDSLAQAGVEQHGLTHIDTNTTDETRCRCGNAAKAAVPELPKPNAYVIDTDNVTNAIARLVAAFKIQNPGIGTFRAECHDGSTVTMRIKGPAAPKRRR